MLAAAPVLLRAATALVALVLFVAFVVLGYLSIVALRRSEGVFMPAGYVALACLAGAVFLLRLAARS